MEPVDEAEQLGELTLPQEAGITSTDSPTPNDTPEENLSSNSTNPIVTISIIAKDLNIYTFQGLVQSNNNFIVPTLDSRLLQITPEGTISTLVEFCQGFECERFGAPFGIALREDNLIVAISGYSFGGSLVRVSLDGKFSTIADLTEVSKLGGPFGVAVNGDEFLVTTATDAMESQGLLVRVTPNGIVKAIADLSEFGIPFAVTVSQGSFVIATERGMLVRVSPSGTISQIANCKSAGLGIPIGLTSSEDSLIVTTNQGLLVRMDHNGTFSTITDLLQRNFGIPSGVIKSRDDLIVTTTAGYLLRVSQPGN